MLVNDVSSVIKDILEYLGGDSAMLAAVQLCHVWPSTCFALYMRRGFVSRSYWRETDMEGSVAFRSFHPLEASCGVA